MQVATDKELKGSQESLVHLPPPRNVLITNWSKVLRDKKPDCSPLVIRTFFLIGEWCIPADGQIVFIHITVYTVFHDKANTSRKASRQEAAG